MNTELRLLLVEDSQDDSDLLLYHLKKAGYTCHSKRVETEAALSSAIYGEEWDAVICDYNLPTFNALKAISLIKKIKPDIPCIVVSGSVGEQRAVETMRAGASDYLMKDSLTRLVPVLQRELKETEIRKKQQQVELALKVSEENLQQAQKLESIGRLAGGIAHDFNNILGIMLLYCDLMATDVSNTKVIQDAIDQIRQSTERGAALTRQLLIFSRKKMVEFRAIKLNELITEHFKMLKRLIGENIVIEFKFAEELPLISADPGQIEQVVMNLIINARDAMPDGGKILVETRPEELTEEFANTHLSSKLGPHVLLSITDTGSGMDEKTKSKIFDPFFTTKPLGKGTGLGLATVYGIVKSINGTIWVYSELQKGTVFKIYIPVSGAKMIEEKAVPTQQNLKGSETILVVEDEQSLRTLYGEMLKKHGYQVLVAENGKIALDIFKKNQKTIDAVVTDMIMPEIGGSTLVQKLFELDSEIKILCMSGYPGENSEPELPKDDRLEYLQKPFNTTSLLEKIRGLLGT